MMTGAKAMLMRTEKNILRHELIGLNCTVRGSNNKSQIGVSGRIVDETKQLIVIEKNNADHVRKKVQKAGTRIAVRIPETGKTAVIDGSIIAIRPEDRIKMKLPQW